MHGQKEAGGDGQPYILALKPLKFGPGIDTGRGQQNSAGQSDPVGRGRQGGCIGQPDKNGPRRNGRHSDGQYDQG